MQTINGWLAIARSWSDYLLYCSFQPMQQPICRPFWYWVMVVSLSVGGLLALWVIWRLVDYKLKLRAALKAEAARQAVDLKAIDASRWEGDKAYAWELDAEEIDRRARQAVDEKRLGR